MPGKIIYLSNDDFKSQGIFDLTGSECILDNLFFRKGDSLKHQQVRETLDLCKKYNDFNINTLIVKCQGSLTIWIEEKAKNAANQPVKSSENQPVKSPVKERSLPTKTVTKKYRGRVYEETVIDWLGVQQIQHNKPRRKYRGQYVD